MNAPPPISANSAAIHDQDRPPPGAAAASADSGSLNEGEATDPVSTLAGAGVTESVPAGTWVAAPAEGAGARSRAEGSDADARRVVVDSDPGVTVSGLGEATRGCVEVAGGAVVAGLSEGRVTLPLSEKSRSWAGPTVSDDGGGAAVTSTGASAFWAEAGLAAASASATAVPFKALTVMRRAAVISPALLVA
jgi:hypothetical protein